MFEVCSCYVSQKTEFEVKISIQAPPTTLRPGMTATADVFTKANDNAVSVPIQCVAVRTVDQLTAKGGKDGKDGKSGAAAGDAGAYTADKDGFVEIVFCLEGGQARARQVTTGIQSDELIEITAGLTEGETVVTGSYRAISKDLANGAVVTVDNEAAPDKAEATRADR